MTNARSIAELPGPKGLPLLGSAHKLVPASRIHLAFERWGREFGPIFRVDVGPRLIIGVNDEEAINAILRDRPGGFRRWSDVQLVIKEINETVPGDEGHPVSEETRAPKSLSFGAGPRFCPGRNLAFLEAKAALATLARNFEIGLDESGGAVEEALGFVMAPRGLRVRLRERQSRPRVPSASA